MGGDQAALGYEALAYLNQMQMAYQDIGKNCSVGVLPSLQNVEMESFRRLKRDNETDRQAIARIGCVRLRTDGQAADFTRHLEAGLNLADLYCDDYFRRIAMHKQMRQFGRSTTNDVGTAASVGLGLAKAGSVLTGGAGALFGLADGLFRNYDNAFVVEPDLGKLLNLVRTAQNLMKASLRKTPPSSFLQANEGITAYAQICSYAGMDNLLNAAITEGSKPETIAETVKRFQTTAADLNKPASVREAEKIEATNEGLKRQKAALDEQKKLEDELKKAKAPADPAASDGQAKSQ
ncbi:hypothetical protein [Sphingomonas humi]